jgi:hypothetical protein
MTRLFLSGLLFIFVSPAQPQPVTTIFRQARDLSTPEPLTKAEASSLGDPFFNLVLKDHPAIANLKEIEDLLQPMPAQRKIFVVDERIPDPTKGQIRRNVMTFDGTNGSEKLKGNVMLSVFFDSSSILDVPGGIEAWGWDERRARYNYYKLDNAMDGVTSWRFRGSSVGADTKNFPERQQTCLACHLNGAPIMKEMAFPWNNWHSSAAPAGYLLPTADPTIKWPVADSRRLKGHLGGAEELEGIIVSSVKHFNDKRIEAAMAGVANGGVPAVDSEGMQELLDARRILRPLFVTTELNLVSSTKHSGLFPFPQLHGEGPDADIVIPAAFFLNADLIGSGSPFVSRGLGIESASRFASFTVKANEYKELVRAAKLRLGNRTPADSEFAWFVPAQSTIDNDVISQLIAKGVVTAQFVAAILTIDLASPIFSKERESLLQFLPDSVRFKMIPSATLPSATNRHPDDLTKKVIANLENFKPKAGTPEAKFLAALNSKDPVADLAQQVQLYHDQIEARLANPQTRVSELNRLFALAIDRRLALLNADLFSTINETGDRLLPVP